MSRRNRLVLIVSASLLGLARLALEVSIPSSFAPEELRPDALRHVAALQSSRALTAQECAERYLDFGTDLQDVPTRGDASTRVVSARVASTEELRAGVVRVTIHNPDAQDDSIYETVDRIYLTRTDKQHWTPIRHEWSHRGRGRIGWTTQPTV